MKKRAVIFIGIFILISLWIIASLGQFNSFDKQKIRLDDTTIEEIKNKIKKENILDSIESTTLIIYKKEQRAEIWINSKNNLNHLLFSDNISIENIQNGTRLYDRESIIPEGIYQIKTVNSNDLNFTIDFPNRFDIEKQQADKRPPLTSNITFTTTKREIQFSKELMTEFLFLAKEANIENTKILIFPNDFRTEEFAQNCLTCPFWIEELYGSLRVYLNTFAQKIQ